MLGYNLVLDLHVWCEVTEYQRVSTCISVESVKTTGETRLN